MAYMLKRFDTATGPLVLTFDFIPPEPTPAQLAKFVPHTCQTCEWCNMCNRPEQTNGQPCTGWEISCDAFCLATIEYYKDIHQKHYG